MEAIIQIANKDSCSHILACASHNKDADLICQEIVKKVPKSTVLRMYAKIVDFKRIPRDLQVSVITFTFNQIKLKYFSKLVSKAQSSKVFNET